MKLTAAKRRTEMVQLLKKQKDTPMSGSQLASYFSVSRQVIVQDISLLKAAGHAVVATSQGYVWQDTPRTEKCERIIVCKHDPKETEKELTFLVDHGITVKDVMIEHPVYGELTGKLMLKSRKDVEHFLNQIRSSQASYLSELTGGIHMHTLEAESEEDIEAAVDGLNQTGILITADS